MNSSAQRSPLDELEIVLKRRAERRTPYITQILKMAENFISYSEEWMNAEAGILEREIELLKDVIEEEQIAEWRMKLEDVKERFKKVLGNMKKLINRAGSGEITSLAEIVRKEGRWTFELEEEQAMDIVSMIVKAFNLARELEDLISAVENEAKRILRLRRLVRLEIIGSGSQ